ncbi:MAG: hypothetical protein PHX86_03095 [Caldisericia bacterium]|nr:hypothetical protein [Caldisericia bacterium]
MIVILSGSFVSLSRDVLQQRQLDICVCTLAEDLQMLRMKSISTHQNLKIVFYPTDNYYAFETEENGLNCSGKYITRTFPKNIGFPFYFGILTPAYVDEYGSICSGSVEFGYSGSPLLPRTLTFKYAGTPSAGGHVILTSYPDLRSSVVIVKVATGRIRVGQVSFFSMDS